MGYNFETIYDHLTNLGYSVIDNRTLDGRIVVYNRKGELLRGFDTTRQNRNAPFIVDRANFNHWLQFMGLPEID